MIETVLGAYGYKKKEITVVGAGAAGLLAAYRLKQADLNVHVVEARSRIGGRLFSSASIQAEFGAWTLSNAGMPELFRALASELGLEIVEGIAPFRHLCIEKNQLLDITSRFIASYDYDPEKARTRLGTIISLSHTVQEALDAFYHDEPVLKLANERLIWGYLGTHPSGLSAYAYKETIMQLCLGGVSDVYKKGPSCQPIDRIKGGNDLLAKKLAQLLDGNITLNMPLVAIGRGQLSMYSLSFADGTTRETDVVILALPVSAYKNLDIEEGLIPQLQRDSIQKICPGSVTKVLVPALGNRRPPGFITAQDYGAAMSEHERFITLYWRTPFDMEVCKQEVISLTEALGWSTPTQFIVVDDEVTEYPYDAVLIIDWVNTPYTNGSFCAYSPANDVFTGAVKIDGIMVNSLFKPAGDLYFVGEAAGVNAPPGSLGAAFESAEKVSSLVMQRLGRFYGSVAQTSIIERTL